MSEERQTTFVVFIAFILFAGVVFTFFVTQQSYRHETPEVDCTQAYDYPMCMRANTPLPQQDPSMPEQFLGLGFVGIAGIILAIWGWKASVTDDGMGIQAPGNQAQAAPSPNTKQSPPPLPKFGSSPSTEPIDHFPGDKTPTTIPNNEITDDMIVQPSTAPKKGPDIKNLGEKK